MTTRPFALTPLLLVLVPALAVGPARADDASFAYLGWIRSEAPTEVSLLVLPDGSGDALSAARILGGSFADATVTIEVIGGLGNPIPDVPAGDLWLMPECATLGPCTYDAFGADHPTDAAGITTFSGPPHAGGWCEGPAYVFANGGHAVDPNETEFAPLAIRYNSPDINGDGVVNMTDLATFAGDYHGAYHYRSDFAWDGAVNLADVTLMAQALGRSCP